MVLNPHQFTAHVKGPHGFPDTEDKPLVWGPNTGDKEGKDAISSYLVDNSQHQLETVFHEPGWDLPKVDDLMSDEFFGPHTFESPEKAPYGHGISGMHYPKA